MIYVITLMVSSTKTNFCNRSTKIVFLEMYNVLCNSYSKFTV